MKVSPSYIKGVDYAVMGSILRQPGQRATIKQIIGDLSGYDEEDIRASISRMRRYDFLIKVGSMPTCLPIYSLSDYAKSVEGRARA